MPSLRVAVETVGYQGSIMNYFTELCAEGQNKMKND